MTRASMPESPVTDRDAPASPLVDAYRKRVHALEELVDVETAEVARLRKALESIHIHQVSHIVNAALAEGSDVLPTQKEH